MQNITLKKNLFGLTLSVFTFVLCSFINLSKEETSITYTFPYKKAGLTPQQAAEHLLSRFTFGSKKIDIDAVANMGLENWFDKQLEGNLEDQKVAEKLQEFDGLKMSNAEIMKIFPDGNEVRKMAIADGKINKNDLKDGDKREYLIALKKYKTENGLRDQRELFNQFISQKILRATYSNNQLQEVLTDFWFNHFNVSMTKNVCAPFIPVFERDAIRPNTTSNFENLVLATAKSPAMLLYLDNFVSMGTNDEMQKKLQKKDNSKRPQGLNENYAREVMELHTLGVDGGYTQQDVTEAARVLTGWTIYPISSIGQMGQIKKTIERIGEDKLTKNGFVHDGDFLFANNRHDSEPKTVLGKNFNGGGYQEGVDLLKMLSSSKSTAKFISKKIATRFVNDNPPISLINKMEQTFLQTNGNIKKVLIAMVSAPEFWTKESLREKTKSPFEYAISSLRSLDATITQPIQIYNWITKMGQKMYCYQAPTGFPDKAQYWINTGSLLNRMNFGLALASKRIPGVQFDLAALNNFHEPESPEDALIKYSAILLPQRNLENTIKRLKPLVNDPSISTKINDAATKTATPIDDGNMKMEMTYMDTTVKKVFIKQKLKERLNKRNEAIELNFGDNSMLAQVVGIIIGSPEFQRK